MGLVDVIEVVGHPELRCGDVKMALEIPTRLKMNQSKETSSYEWVCFELLAYELADDDLYRTT